MDHDHVAGVQVQERRSLRLQFGIWGLVLGFQGTGFRVQDSYFKLQGSCLRNPLWSPFMIASPRQKSRVGSLKDEENLRE